MPAEAAKPAPSAYEERSAYEAELLVGAALPRVLAQACMGPGRLGCHVLLPHARGAGLAVREDVGGLLAPLCEALPLACQAKACASCGCCGPPPRLPLHARPTPPRPRVQAALKARGSELPELKSAPEVWRPLVLAFTCGAGSRAEIEIQQQILRYPTL